MSKDNPDRFNLSRRKALGALGVAGAGIALGRFGGDATSALFTDVESSDVTFTAGSLDLLVDAEVFLSHVYDDGTEVQENGAAVSISPTNPPSDTLTIDFDDVKPGDCICVVLSAHLDGNPAWVWSQCTLDSSSENGLTEPEKDEYSGQALQDEMNSEEGELDDEMQFAAAVIDQKADNLQECPEELDNAPRRPLNTVLSSNGTFTLFDGDNNTQQYEPLAVGNTAWLGYLFCVPPEVGNEIQTDSVSVSCTFRAEQARNNPVPSVVEDGLVSQTESDLNNPYVNNTPSVSTNDD